MEIMYLVCIYMRFGSLNKKQSTLVFIAPQKWENGDDSKNENLQF